MRHTSTNSHGFTIVEIIIVVVVAGILLPLLFGPLSDLYTSFTRDTKAVIQIADTHSALRLIKNDITYATTFNPSFAAPSPLGTNNDGTAWDWRGADIDHRVLILTTYATTANRATLAYAADCSTLQTNTYVYFVKNNTLYRRIIKGASACASTPISQKTSCAVGVSHGSCEAVDAVIANNVTKFSVDYYINSSATNPIAGQYNSGSTAPTDAQTLVITLTTSIGNGQEQTTSTRTIRVTRTNGATA